MSTQDDSPRESDQAVRLRWLARLGVAAVAVWFLVDGLRGIWSEASTLTVVLVVAAVVLGVALIALCVRHLVGRGPAE